MASGSSPVRAIRSKSSLAIFPLMVPSSTSATSRASAAGRMGEAATAAGSPLSSRRSSDPIQFARAFGFGWTRTASSK